MDPVELAGDHGPGGAGVVLGDADEDQGEEAKRDVGPDAVLLTVAVGADLQDRLEVPESAFDVEEAFEASGGVCGREAVVGAGQQVLAVQFCRLFALKRGVRMLAVHAALRVALWSIMRRS